MNYPQGSSEDAMAAKTCPEDTQPLEARVTYRQGSRQSMPANGSMASSRVAARPMQHSRTSKGQIPSTGVNRWSFVPNHSGQRSGSVMPMPYITKHKSARKPLEPFTPPPCWWSAKTTPMPRWIPCLLLIACCPTAAFQSSEHRTSGFHPELSCRLGCRGTVPGC